MNYVPELTHNEIRHRALAIKSNTRLRMKQPFPINWVTETLDDGFLENHEAPFLEVSFRSELGEALGLTDMQTGQIKIREDIYDLFTENDPEGRYTVAHELGHVFLHLGAPLHKVPSHIQVHDLNCPEIQADIYACELMLNIEYVQKWFEKKPASHFANLFGLPIREVEKHLIRLAINGDIRSAQYTLNL